MRRSGDPLYFADFPVEADGGRHLPALIDFRDWNQHGGPAAIAVPEARDAANVIQCFRAGNLRHLIQRDSPWRNQELRNAAAILENPASYFEHPARGLLERPEGYRSWSFDPASVKEQIFEEIIGMLEPLGRKNLVGFVTAVAEEIFMNALSDAPRAAIRRGVETAPYESRGPAVLHFAHDGERLVLACEDPYGELVPAAFVERMDEVYTQGAGRAIRMEPGAGAGIGCVLMFENSESLYLGVQPGRKTLVSCVIAIQASLKKRAGFRKNIHLIY